MSIVIDVSCLGKGHGVPALERMLDYFSNPF